MNNQPPINLGGGGGGARSLYQFTLQDTDTDELYKFAPILEDKIRRTFEWPIAKERRQHERVPCNLGAELYMQGAISPVRVQLRNISVGGCFLAMPTLPPESGALKLVVWLNGVKLNLQGVIASRRAGFGISIKFTGVGGNITVNAGSYMQ